MWFLVGFIAFVVFIILSYISMTLFEKDQIRRETLAEAAQEMEYQAHWGSPFDG